LTGERGQALVELALALPIVLSLMFGVLIVAEVGVARLALEHAAAEGARAGALTNDDRLIRGTVEAAVTPLDASRVVLEIDPTADRAPRNGAPRGSILTIRLRYPIAVPFGVLGVGRLEVRGAAARRIEWTRD
jgi:hypothetical protein